MKTRTDSSSIYTKSVQSACKCDLATAWRIEREMRRAHGPLDNLTAASFRRHAKKAEATLRLLDETPGRDALEKLQYLMAQGNK